MGVLLGILGLGCLIEAHRVWNGWNGTGTMPVIVGGIFIVLSVAYLISRSPDTTPIKWPDKKERVGVGVVGTSFSCYIGVMPWLGYPISTWLFLAIVARYISPSRIYILFIWTGAVAVGTYIIFKKLLGMYLPVGFLGL